MEQDKLELLNRRKRNIKIGIVLFISFVIPFFIHFFILIFDKTFYYEYFFISIILFIIGVVFYSIILFTNSYCPYCNKFHRQLIGVKYCKFCGKLINKKINDT